MPHSLNDQNSIAESTDRPPDYTADRTQSNSQLRQTIFPSLDTRRHQTQGGFVSAKVTGISVPAKLYMNLDQPNHYQAGDIVSGSLELASEHAEGQDINVGSISISISGRCTTTRPLRESHVSRRTLQLFADKKGLFSGPAKLHAPNKSALGRTCPNFPFQFMIPSNYSIPEDFGTGSFFNPDPNQALPPSFIDENNVDRASVLYELKWELRAPDSRGYYMQGSFYQSLSLNIYTPRTIQEPTVKFILHAKSFSYQSLELLPVAERKFHERPMTLGQKLGLRSVAIDRQPKVTFTVTALVPSVAIIGQPLPLTLKIDHDVSTSTVSSSPIVNLIRFQVFLRTETSICGIKTESVEGEYDQTCWTTSSEVIGKLFTKAMPRVERLDLRKVMDLELDHHLPPSFKSFNIARTYSLGVAGTVKCGGKSFSIWSPMTRCTLLSKEYAPQLPGYGDPAPAAEEEFTDEVPPPYANHVQSDVSPQDAGSPDRGEHSRRSNHYISSYSVSAAAASTVSTASASTNGCGGSTVGEGGC